MMSEVVVVTDWTQVRAVYMPKQAHTARVADISSGHEDVYEDCDALVTNTANLTLGVHTRDCAPVCMGDGVRVAVAHVGWRGLCGGIVENVLGQFGGVPKEVFVGPFLHAFEVRRDGCVETIEAKFGGQYLTEKEGITTFHFKEALASLLPTDTVFDPRNTATDVSLPSHRHKRVFGHIITTVQV